MLLPFLPLILRERGLTDIEAAFVLGAIGIAAIFGPPMFGNIIDRGVAVPRVMQSLFVLVALISPLYLLLEGSAPAFFLVFAHFLCVIPILSLSDQYTMNLISMRQPSSVAFQSIRPWGGVGFMFPTIILLLTERIDLPPGAVVIFVCALSALAGAALAGLLPRNIQLLERSKLPLRDAIAEALSPRFRHLFIATTLGGIAAAIFYTFFPRYLQELGLPASQIGLVILFGVLIETVLIPLTGWFIARLGILIVISLGVATAGARLWILLLTDDLYIVILSQILHAPFVIGLFIAVPLYLDRHAAPKIKFSLQSLYTMSVLGISRITGPWIVGIVLSQSIALGTQTFSIAFGIGALFGTLGYIWFVAFILSNKGQPAQDPALSD